MIVETYSDKYYNDVVEIVGNFYEEAIRFYDMGLDKEKLAQSIVGFKESNAGNMFLLVVDGKCQGILAGIEPPSLLNNKRIFQEVIWYVNERYRKYGVMLLARVQKLLRNQGFDTMIMAALEDSKPEKIKALYERMGYRKLETHFIKNLNG